MIDIHCHILPGIDDGAGSMQESLEMALQAVEQGISTVIATPHHADGFHNNDAFCVHDAVDRLNARLQMFDIPLHVAPGQEIRLNSRIIGDFQEGKLAALAGSRYVLIELSPHHLPDKIIEMFYELQVGGLIPVIAHPERNSAFTKKLELLHELVERGALCQLTAHSLTGLFGRRIQKLSIQLCKLNLIHFIASDAHNAFRRGFHLKEAYEVINKAIGEKFSKYCVHNAECLLANRPIDKAEPVKPPKISIGRYFALRN